MSIFLCPIKDCGRRFKEEDKLRDHLYRRHGELENLKDISNLPIETNKKEEFEKIVEQKKEDILQQEKELQEELAKFDEKEDEIAISGKDILESKKKLTKEFILEKSGTDTLEEITQLILREEGLYIFESTPTFNIDKIGGIEYLSLSHNRLINLMGISRLVNLIELNINFNLVEDLSPLSECLNLEKLYASNNRIKSIIGIKELTSLKVLVLFKNRIKNFDETVQILSEFPNLKELDLDQNPCARKFTYKYDLLYHVRVEKLDGERVHEIDYELAKSFKKDKNTSNDNIEYEQQRPQGNTPLQRPSTAPGRMKKGFFVDKLKNTMKMHKFPELTGIPENSTHENLEELEHEIEILKKQKTDLEKTVEELKTNEKLLKLENDRMKNENSILKVEASNAYILLDQNQQLKKELESIKIILGNNNEARNIKEENAILHEKLAELLRENKELKASNERRSRKMGGSSRNSDPSQEEDRSDVSNSSFTLDSGRVNNFRIRSRTPVGTSPNKKAPVGTITPKSRIIKDQNSSRSNSQTQLAQSTSRGGSVERPKMEITARKIIRVVNPVHEKPENVEEKVQNDPLDKEIEDLLIRNSLQLSQLRSELRNFDFLETTDRNRTQIDDDDNEDDIKNYDDDDGDIEQGEY